jgi:hypothetical protein
MNGSGGPMSANAGSVLESCGGLLQSMLTAMLIAETEGRMRDAGLYAEQAAALIAKLRTLRLAGPLVFDQSE